MIAALYNLPVDRAAMQRFSFHNRDSHDLAAQAILKQMGITLKSYILDPVPENDFAGWLYQHQTAHDEVNEILGTGGNDFTNLDPANMEQLAVWIQNHADEHVQWGNILGIG